MGLFNLFRSPKKDILKLLFLEHKIKDSIKKINEELDEHLESINDNTGELQANYEYLCQLDLKVEKLSEICEENRALLLELLNQAQDKIEEENIKNVSLSTIEQAIFLNLYTESKPLTYKELSQKVGLSEFLVNGYIAHLVEKGIPVVKRFINRTVFLELQPHFKELQAKKGIIKISQATIKQYI